MRGNWSSWIILAKVKRATGLFSGPHQWRLCLLVSVLILTAFFIFFMWCTRVSNDMGGDSFAGLFFAVSSTTFMFLAALSFSLRRRSRERSVGGLNAVLNWHICFGAISLILVFFHSFGNYNPRTGTYALYGMIALVISGIIGRTLDRVAPRIMAQRVQASLTYQGEDRVDHILHEMSGRKSISLIGFDAFYMHNERYMSTLEQVQHAQDQELFFRYVIRYWRIFHIILAVVTVSLTLWHIEYAFALIIPAIQKFGIGYLLPWP